LQLNISTNARIDCIEFAELQGERMRSAGCNARRGVHGKFVTEKIVRVSIDGSVGFGWSRVTREQARLLVGKSVADLFAPDHGFIREEFRSIEFPLLDWLGQRLKLPVFAVISDAKAGSVAPLTVPCYDTSLYFDDLHLSNDADAVRLLQAEVAEGIEAGHRHFKIKVGRGGRYMPVIEGLRRDVAIVRGIRELTGPSSHLMVDANNGFNLNLTKDFLAALDDVKLYWLEEAFHEDDELYEDLKEWMNARGMNVLLSDGEGLAAPPIVEWAERGLIDVLQYDICHYGFANWLLLGAKLDRAQVKSAPHNYGSGYGGYASGHIAAAIKGFQFVEWDAVKVNGVDSSAYSIANGMLNVPSLPGFGLQLDKEYYTKKVAENGWVISHL
jgi:L-rhamnonate dehydratase